MSNMVTSIIVEAPTYIHTIYLSVKHKRYCVGEGGGRCVLVPKYTHRMGARLCYVLDI